MNKPKVLAVMVGLNILWGPVNYFIVTAKDSGFSPTSLEVVRWVIIALGLGGLALLPSVRKKVVSKMPGYKTMLAVMVIGLCLSGPAHLLYYHSLGKVGTVEGTILGSTAPLTVGLLSGLFLREKIHAARWTSLFLGAIGAYIASVGFALPLFGSQHLLWDGVYLLGTTLEAIGGIFLTMFARRSSGLIVMAFEASGMAMIGILVTLLMPNLFPFTVPHHFNSGWMSLGYLAVCAGIVTFGTWMIVVETVPLSVMVATLALQTPVAAVFGALFLHEKLTLNMGFGSLLICAALFLIAKEKHEPVKLFNAKEGLESGTGLSESSLEEVTA